MLQQRDAANIAQGRLQQKCTYWCTCSRRKEAANKAGMPLKMHYEYAASILMHFLLDKEAMQYIKKRMQLFLQLK
jgi:hypothetical protein